MSVFLLTMHLLWAQAQPANPALAPPPSPTTASGAAATADTAQIKPMAPNVITNQPAAPVRPPALKPMSPRMAVNLAWIYFASDPTVAGEGVLGGTITWLKVIGLIGLIVWLLYWMITGLKERVVGRGEWFDYVGLAALILTPVMVMLQVLQTMGRLTLPAIGATPMPTALWMVDVLCYAIWIEFALWRAIRRLGDRLDVLVLAGIHVGLVLGMAFGLWMQLQGYLLTILIMFGAYVPVNFETTWREGLVVGTRIGMTYMGYVVLLRIAAHFAVQVWQGRPRRLYAIARLSVYEATRRMWAPWVVLTVFLLVLAFTHWFLQAPRPAEMGRLYVGTLTLLCSALLTLMVTVLTPLSLPTDIQQQTIYTVVSKPVQRLEMIWGRMIGYMALVTFLLVLFGGISLGYLWRTVGLTQRATLDAARKAAKDGNATEAKQLYEQADQLYTRMTAREPIKGSLSFLDSRGTPHAMGIDVGADVSLREPRSHIEGATPSAAIWSYGRVPDPFTPPGRQPRILNRIIPVERFLFKGTIEGDLDEMYRLEARILEAQQSKQKADLSPAESSRIDQAIARNQQELERVRSDYEAKKRQSEELEARRAEATEEQRTEDVNKLKKEIDRLHSPPINVQMTFNVYRTTKGRIGEPVFAELNAFNPRTGAKYEHDIFAIREYYTNKLTLDPAVLAGSNGALRIEVRCLSPTQYLGMAESDLFLLPAQGNFGVNYIKGLFGIWLQAMVLTAIGVFAGTFLSWPVALLTTIFFFVAGQLAFSFLVDFTRQAIMGGGPFESLIRLLTHDNQMSDLAPTASVVLAKTLDSLVMPLMSMLVYIVPNFNRLDVTDSVANGFAVSWGTLVGNTLLALAYAVPFSVAGYYILKRREVAA